MFARRLLAASLLLIPALILFLLPGHAAPLSTAADETATTTETAIETAIVTATTTETAVETTVTIPPTNTLTPTPTSTATPISTASPSATLIPAATFTTTPTSIALTSPTPTVLLPTVIPQLAGNAYLPVIFGWEPAPPTETPTPVPTAIPTTVPTATLAPPPTAPPTVTPVAVPPTATPRPSNCHPSYPDFCIPPPPPDLDCPDIGRKDFTVLPPDPHRLDRDGDGRGCEG